MLNKLRTRAQDEKGFTLIELLVVILIVGILAAIALPTFLGQQKKGQDASAKSDARNAVSAIESCFADNPDATGGYGNCDDAGELATVENPIQNTVTPTGGSATQKFSVVATSKSGNTFTITKTTAGAYTRDCTTHGKGACRATADAQGNYW